MSALAVIPARGGSKRIPKKNIKPFFGTPMLVRAIRTAQDSGVFSKIVVSTDCEETRDLALKEGAEAPFRRPKNLSGDHIGTLDVIVHAVQEMQTQSFVAENVCCLYPCSPFTSGRIIRDVFDAWGESNAPYGFPVCAFPSSPQRALALDARNRVAPLDPRFETIRTQDLEPAYYDAGQFYWGSAQAWLSRLPIHSHGFASVIHWTAAVDIDTPEDWRRAEILYEALHLGEISR
jgi:pseudaminic acid cytidylyltransferase